MRKRIMAVALSVAMVAGGAAPAFAQTSALGDILGAIGSLVGSSTVTSGSIVTANIPATSTSPAVTIQAGSSPSTQQGGLNGLLGGVLGGTYQSASSLAGPNGLSASSSTNGGYGLASSVQSLSAGLAGLLSGLLKG